MKTKLLYLVLCLLMAACGSDDDPTVAPEQPKPEATCYVQQAVTTIDGATTTERYSYDDALRLVKTEHFVGDELQKITEHLYDAKGRLQRENIVNANGELTRAVTYEFDARDQVIRYTTFEPWLQDKLIPKNTYTSKYDSVIFLQATTAWEFVDNRAVLEGKTTYRYSPDSTMLSASVTGKGGTVIENITFTYDKQKTPMYGLPHHAMSNYPAMGYPYLHNIQTCSVKDAAKADKPATSYSSAYTYNAKGYPVKADITYGDSKVKQVSYTYTCP